MTIWINLILKLILSYNLEKSINKTWLKVQIQVVKSMGQRILSPHKSWEWRSELIRQGEIHK